MTTSMLNNLIKISCELLSLFKRGYKFQTVGVISCRGLKDTREEEYFTKQNNKILEYLKEKENSPTKKTEKPYSFDNPLDQDPILRACNSTSTVRHKNLVEEAYFLNEHCDCLQLLKAKSQKKEETNNS